MFAQWCAGCDDALNVTTRLCLRLPGGATQSATPTPSPLPSPAPSESVPPSPTPTKTVNYTPPIPSSTPSPSKAPSSGQQVALGPVQVGSVADITSKCRTWASPPPPTTAATNLIHRTTCVSAGVLGLAGSTPRCV